MSTAAGKTSVTRHVTRGRLDRLHQMLGPRLDEVLTEHIPADRHADYLSALCVAWFGPIGPREPRSDRGGLHRLPDRVYDLSCQTCAVTFVSSRHDGRYCSPACRQKAYRRRNGGAA